MVNTRRAVWVLALSLLAFPPLLAAHQPILAIDGLLSKDQPFEIERPEISKAIYSELISRPHFYRITSERPFNFYVGITKPKLDKCPLGKTFSFDVLDSDFGHIAKVNGDHLDWWPWFEPFGRKWYWIGPEIGNNFKHTQVFDAGTYYIRVYNSSNRGHYVLAVGDIESFPVGAMFRMVRDLSKINNKFWKEANCSS